MTTPLINALKFNLQEKNYPYFDDDELELLLEQNDNNIYKASWKGCELKAVSDDKATIGPITMSSNRDYWLRLAEQYKTQYIESISKVSSSSPYKSSMKRADLQ